MRALISFCAMFFALFTGSAQTFNKLPIPDSLHGPNCTLRIADTFAQLRSGNQTITGAINGHTFWGPTVFVKRATPFA